jgi:hypothetical protein
LSAVEWENNRAVWHGYPAADNEYHTPIKGFIIETDRDSVLVKCPYANDTIWYVGLYVHKKPVGIHRMYYENGKPKFEHDYLTSKIKVYDITGKLIKEKMDDIGRDYDFELKNKHR